MEKNFYHLKFPDKSNYKGDFDIKTKNMFTEFGILTKKNEIFLSYKDQLLYDFLCKIIRR